MRETQSRVLRHLRWSAALVMWLSLCLRKQAIHWGPNYHPQNKKDTNKEMKQKLSWECKRETIQKRVYCYFRGYLESCHPSIPVQSFTIFLMVREATQQEPSTSGWILSSWALHSASILTVFQVMMLLFQLDHQNWEQHHGPWNASVSCFQISGPLAIWQLCTFYCKSHSTKNWLSRYLLYLTCFLTDMLPTINNVTCYWALKRLLHCGCDLHFPDGWWCWVPLSCACVGQLHAFVCVCVWGESIFRSFAQVLIRLFFWSWVVWILCIFWILTPQFSPVQFSRSVVSNSLRPHGLQPARLPCPPPTPRAYLKSCPLSWCCHPTISSFVVPFSSCLQYFNLLFVNIFSYSVGGFFILLIVSFPMQKHLSLM